MCLAKGEGFDAGRTWTVALAGHRSSGKTSLAETLLATTGVVRQPGRVEAGTTLLDFEEDERRRHRSRRNGYAWLPWEGCRVELIDVPGMAESGGDRAAALSAVDAVVLVLDAVAGVEAGADEVLAVAKERDLPVIVVLTKIDRVVDADAAASRVAARLGAAAVVVHQPLRDHEGRVCGVVDLVAGQAIRYADDGTGAWSREPLPRADIEARERAHAALCDAVAGADDALLEQYLEYFELTPEQLKAGLRSGVAERRLVPILLASGTRGVGGSALLDALVSWLPPAREAAFAAIDADGAVVRTSASERFLARLVSRHRDGDGNPYAVFRVVSGAPPRSGQWTHARERHALKVRKLYQLRGPRRAVLAEAGPGALVGVWEVVPGNIGDTWGDAPAVWLAPPRFPERQASWTVAPVRQDDGARDRLRTEVANLAAMDPALAVEPGTWPPVLSGLSETHLRLSVAALRAATGLALTTEVAPVRYLETPAGSATGVEGLHVREGDMGLVEEFGACVVDLDPQPVDEGNRWAEALGPDDEDELPRKYRPAIYEGISRGLNKGPAGYPVVGAFVRLVGGRYDMLSSTEEHFVAAGEVAVRRALEASGTAILEPWCTLRIDVPGTAVGDAIHEISSSRGRILGVEASEDGAVLRALLPERELRSFGERLLAATRGRGRFERSPSHYEPLPRHLVAEVRARSAAPVATRRPAGSDREAC